MACKIAMRRRHERLTRLVAARAEVLEPIIKEANTVDVVRDDLDFNIKLIWSDMSISIMVDRCEVTISSALLNEVNTETSIEFASKLMSVNSTALKIERALKQCQLNERMK